MRRFADRPFITCLITLTLALVLSQGVSAQVNQYVFSDPAPIETCSPNFGLSDVNATAYSAQFFPASSRLIWSVTFAPVANPLTRPEAFTLVIDNGPMPRGRAGELAIFYFDGRDPAAPELLVYGYNGINSPPSSMSDGSDLPGIQQPDLILTSRISRSWINTQTVVTNPDGSRTFTFDINASAIINHSPLWPTAGITWYGTGFDSNFGIWLHAMGNLAAAYDPTTGALTDWYYGIGFPQNYDCWDYADLSTNSAPLCVGSNQITAEVGSQVSASFTGTNPDCTEMAGDPTFCGAASGNLTVTYAAALDGAPASLPAASVVSPANGTSGPSPLQSSFAWSPSSEFGGKTFDLTVTFTDQQALTGSCLLRVTVPVEPPKDCLNVVNGSAVVDRCGVCDGDGSSCLGCSDVDVLSQLFALDGGAQEQRGIVEAALQRLLVRTPGNRSNAAYARKVRKLANALAADSWTLTWQLPKIVTSCTNTQFCVQSDNSVTINEYVNKATSLKALVDQVFARMVKQGLRLKNRDRAIAKAAAARYATTVSVAQGVPTLVSACS